MFFLREGSYILLGMFEKAIENIIYMHMNMHAHTHIIPPHTHNLDVALPYGVVMFPERAINYPTDTSVPNRKNSSLNVGYGGPVSFVVLGCLAEPEAIY